MKQTQFKLISHPGSIEEANRLVEDTQLPQMVRFSLDTWDEVRDVLRLAHDILDAKNAYILIPRCTWCHEYGYGPNGLNHTPDCVIVRLRKYID